MNAPENFYAILGVPIDADSDTLKRAYRQLARRYHPDLAGPGGAVEMKRINRAYAVLSDPDKRQQYDTIIGGVIDLRKKGFVRPRPHPQAVDPAEDLEFSGLNIFSTKGPLHTGPVIHSTLGIFSTLSSVRTVQGLLIAAGSLDGKGMLWQIVNGKVEAATSFTADPTFTIESLRELRFSAAGALLAGWGRLGLHVWDAYSGELLWSHSLLQRAVSAHYSLDMTLQVTPDGKRQAQMALPLLTQDPRSPNAWGVRGTDVLMHDMNAPAASLSDPLVCTEEKLENRRFLAIRMRALSQDTHTLITLSCAQMPHEEHHMILVRRWDLSAKGRMSSKARPQIAASIVIGRCEDCTPPYAVTPDTTMIAFVSTGRKILLCDTTAGTYSEIASGTMGGSAKLALSSDGQWLAAAREDSEVNEGVIDLWSISTGQIVQKLYHPWQISALHFTDQRLPTHTANDAGAFSTQTVSKTRLVVALTDGTIQVWE